MVTSGHLTSLMCYFKPGVPEARTWLRLYTLARFMKVGDAGMKWVDRIFAEATTEPAPKPSRDLGLAEEILEDLRLLKRKLSPVARAAEAHLAILRALCASSDATAEEILARVDKKKIDFAAYELGYIRDALVGLRQRGFVEQSPKETRRWVSGKPKMQRILVNRLSVLGAELVTEIERKEKLVGR